uniref:Uncharacterized protein n=1 Tax=Avena sativa TaxID=4498 RepID=A0ACD5ZCZ5_AVESA
MSARARARSVARNAAPCKLKNLRELQLLMFAMSDENMDDIYVFLMNCCSPRLERLFVQLPTRGNQCAPKKELSGSESEEEGSVEAELEEELSGGEAPEEDVLHEELSEGELPEEDGLLEDSSEGETPEEDELEEQLSEVEVPEEDELDEYQSEAFENLMLLKMIDFRGHDNEMELVRLVLRKSARLNQLILFIPTSKHPKGMKEAHMDIIETKLWFLRKASPDAQIILSEPDDSAIQPLHCEGFVKVS